MAVGEGECLQGRTERETDETGELAVGPLCLKIRDELEKKNEEIMSHDESSLSELYSLFTPKPSRSLAPRQMFVPASPV